MDYYVQMSEDFIKIMCGACAKVVSRTDFAEHECVLFCVDESEKMDLQ